MIVSWNWLRHYVDLDMDPAELAHRLAMAGLNHEKSEPVGDDLAIDLEVTSNRPDCLGHLGVAREIAVLWQRPLKTPSPAPQENGPPIDDLTKVTIQRPDLCPRYTARLLRGVKVGPSPDWLARRLHTVGVPLINNIVDISNYVMMECGQPLHAFDFAKLCGPEIIVREAREGEPFEAIDHKTYCLEAGMCVIGDSRWPVALGGVMGGADTEVSRTTADVLIEAAEFAPLSIRNTARQLNLHSPSSYRFERGVDPVGVDWASRRCCEKILEVAGGQLCKGVLDVGRPAPPRPPIRLRLSQLKRILGIDIPREEVRRILAALGGEETRCDAATVSMTPPSWRRDLTREIDLVEEVARIHGYDAIPENVSVPIAPSHRRDEDRVTAQVRGVLASAGFDEAMTSSVVPAAWSDAFSPWTEAEPLRCLTPILKGADRLRRSLTPSLLETRRVNEALANPVIELFEIARVYLAAADGPPVEQSTLGVVSGGDYYRVKGVVEALVASLKSRAELQAAAMRQPLLDPERSAELRLDGRLLGYLGEVSDEGRKQFSLREPATIAELKLDALADVANLIPQHAIQSPFPAIARDLNVVLDESVRWADLAGAVRRSGGPWLERVEYQETYRDPKTDGPGKKRLLFSFSLRAADRTLTSQEADQVRDEIVAAIRRDHGGVLLGQAAARPT